LIGAKPLKQHNQANSDGINQSGYSKVPLLEWEQIEPWLNKKMQKPDKLFATNLAVSATTFALRLKDSAMHPNFPKGTTVILDPQITPVEQDLVLAKIGDHQPILRQLLLDEGREYLKAFNSKHSMTPAKDNPYYIGVMVQANIDFYQQVCKKTTSKQTKRLETNAESTTS